MKTLSEHMRDYESVSKTSLVPRVPVIVRIDGRAFRTFTKGFKKPYDQLLAFIYRNERLPIVAILSIRNTVKGSKDYFSGVSKDGCIRVSIVG